MAVVGLLWLGLSAGCSPPDPCKDGECCMPNTPNLFVKRLDGIRVDYINVGFVLKEPIKIMGRRDSLIDAAFTCQVQEDLIAGMHLKSNTMIDKDGKIRPIDSTRAYPYRLWGTFYETPGIHLLVYDAYAIRVEKIENVY
jgi:hypothetical protein